MVIIKQRKKLVDLVLEIPIEFKSSSRDSFSFIL